MKESFLMMPQGYPHWLRFKPERKTYRIQGRRTRITTTALHEFIRLNWGLYKASGARHYQRETIAALKVTSRR